MDQSCFRNQNSDDPRSSRLIGRHPSRNVASSSSTTNLTSNAILTTKTKTFTLSPEDQEVDAILQKSSSMTSSTSSSSDEDEGPKQIRNKPPWTRLQLPARDSNIALPLNNVGHCSGDGSSSGASGRRPRRPHRRQRPNSKSRDENQESGIKRRHSHAGVTVVKHRTSSVSGNDGTAMTSLERLIRTHPIWFLPHLTRDDATHLLLGKEHGSFIVRQSSQLGTMAVSVRQTEDPRVEHYLIEQEVEGKLRLESSDHHFENILSLVYHYATVKDELPQLLILPQTLREVDSRQNLSSLALLGKDFWRYPMSFPDSKRCSVSIISQSDDKCRGQKESVSIPEKPRRKMSVFESRIEPSSNLQKTSCNLLDETLCGLQEVSDMLQASLKELERNEAKTQSQVPARPPPPPLRSSSHLASPVSSPGRTRRRSDTEALLRPITPILPNCGNKSPNIRSASSRHSVCRMVVTQISETKFPVPRLSINNNNNSIGSPRSSDPETSNSISSPKLRSSRITEHYSQSNKKLELIRSGVRSDESPVHVEHSILHDHVLPRLGIENGNNSSSYYRSSVADKMSDYEDIWCDPSSASIRSITPAESENQFKAYLAHKLLADDTHLDLTSPCNNNNNHVDKHLDNNHNSNTVSSSISSTSSNLSAQSVTSSKISASLTSSHGTRSSISSPVLSRNKIVGKIDILGTDSLSSSSTSSRKQDDHSNPEEDPVYSDPLDALEKAEDTRIYNFPDFGDEEEEIEPIYEEAKATLSKESVPEKPEIKSELLSSDDDDDVGEDNEEDREEDGQGGVVDVNELEVLFEKRLSSDQPVDWKEPGKLERSAVSDENVAEAEHSSLTPQECPLSRVRKWSSPCSTSPSTSSSSRKDHEISRERKISSPPAMIMTKNVSPERRNGRRENRLSAVIGKYIRPTTSSSSHQGGPKTNSWQVDSSSWEFLNENCNNEDDPLAPTALEKEEEKAKSKVENPYDNLPIKSGKESGDVIMVGNKENLEIDTKFESSQLDEDILAAKDLSVSSETITESSTKASSSSRERIQSFIRHLSDDESSLFGQSVGHFLTCTLESKEQSPYVVMRNMRQFMTGLKNYLSRSGEGKLWAIVEEERNKLREDEFLNLDSIFEEILHVLVVRPLQPHLAHLFRVDFERSGCLQLIDSQMAKVRQERPTVTGMEDFPDIDLPNVVEVCKESFKKLEVAFSPADKLNHLLIALKQIVHLSSTPDSNVIVERFCSLLSIILSHSASKNIEIESELMWGLLPRPLLSAEAGYYLTLLSSSIHFIKTFQMKGNSAEEKDVEDIRDETLRAVDPSSSSLDSKRSKNSTVSSLMTTNSLSSRTSHSLQRGQSGRSQDSSSTIIRVLVPDEITGNIVTKSIPVKIGMSGKDIVRMLAHKLKVTNTEDFSLFSLTNGKESPLTDASKVNELRVKSDVIFVYRRTDAKIIWPSNISSTSTTVA